MYNRYMSNLQFVVMSGEPDPNDKQIMVDGMLAYHASKGHVRKTDQYSIVVKDEDNKTIGCVIVSFLWSGMEIESLWVEESHRNQGLGTRLMSAVEAEGKKRGSTVAYTNTFTWQAPEFYKKIGYTLFGQLENFPQGNTLYYFSKRLQ